MKSKRLISLLCAITMTVSAFTGLVMPHAGAADDNVLWSDTFDGYENEVTYFHTDEGQTLGYDNKVLVDGTQTARNTYKMIKNAVLYTTDRADDSSYFQMTDDADGGKALTTQVSRFSNATRGAKIEFNKDGKPTTYSPTADKDLVLAFKVKAENAAGTPFDTAITLNNDISQEIDFVQDLGMTLGEWAEVKAVITTSGTKVYVNGGTAEAMSLTAKSLSTIDFNGLENGVNDTSSSGAKKSSSHPFGYPTISLDDVVVYTANAGDGVSSAVPDAETHQPGEIDYEVVPAGEAPEGLHLVGADNFNDTTTGRLIYIGTDGETVYDSLNTVRLRIGPATDAQGTTKWEIYGNTNTDPKLGTEKFLSAANGPRSTTNRGPKMEFKKGEIAERENVVAQFATKLHAGANGPAEVIFSGDFVASEKKGNIASPAAMITTDAEAASGVYACDNPLEKGGANVLEAPDNTWMLVTIEATRAKDKMVTAKISVDIDGTKTYIFGSETEYAELKNSSKSGISTLPFISFRSGNDNDFGVSNSTNDIDNIAVYSSVEPEKAEKHSVTIDYDDTTKTALVETEETEAFDAVLLHAMYEEGVLISVKSYPLTGIVSGTPARQPLEPEASKGDKLMVWGSRESMVPYGEAYEVTGGILRTYVVEGTVDEGIFGVKLVSGEDTYEGEIDGTDVTFNSVPAGIYNVEIEYVTNYGAVENPITTVTVPYLLPTPLAFTSKSTVVTPDNFTVKGTVDAGIDAVKLVPASGEAIDGTINGTEVTFNNVTSNTYTVTVTYKNGYEQDTLTPAQIVVIGDNASAFTVVSKKKLYTFDVSVDAGIAAITLGNHPNTYEGVIRGTTATFTNVPTGTNYTVTVEYKSGYHRGGENPLVTVPVPEGTTYSFTSEKDVVTPTGYSVSLPSTTHYGTVKLKVGDGAEQTSLSNITAGTDVTVVATPNDGYIIDQMFYDKNPNPNQEPSVAIDKTTKTFKMPAYDITVYAFFSEPQYVVEGTVDAGIKSVRLGYDYPGEIADGKVKFQSLSGSDVVAGTYNVVIKYNEGYKAPANPITTVTVPLAEGTTLAFTSVKAYKASTLASYENGAVTLSAASGGEQKAELTDLSAGDSVFVTATPAAGCVLTQLYYIEVNDGTETIHNITNNTFTMPADDVRVCAAFAPQISGTASITGTAKVGETLTADTSAVSAGSAALSYKWQSAADGGEYADIPNAEASTYVPGAADEGKTIRVVVTAVGYEGSVISAATAAVAPADVSPTTYSVTKGTVTGGTIKFKVGEGTPEDTLNITAGTTVTVVATPADAESELKTLTYTVNGGQPVTVTGGTFNMPTGNVVVSAEFGAKLYAVAGTIGTGIASVKLTKDGQDYTGEVNGTAVTFSVPAGTYTVVATAAAGYVNPAANPAAVTVSASATTAAFTTTATPSLTGTAAITGTLTTGETLTATLTDGPAGATLSYKWFEGDSADACTSEIAGATGSTYVPQTAGKFIKVEITAEGYDGALTATTSSAIQATVVTRTVTFNAGEGSFANDQKTSAVTVNDGEKITAIPAVTAPDGYTLTGWLKTGETDAVTEATLKDTAITADAEYTAQYAKNTYTVSAAADIVNGSITFAENVEGATAAAPLTIEWGKTVKVTATPTGGYELTALSYSYEGIAEGEGAIALTGENAMTFTMPKANVTVTATFGKLPVVSYDFDNAGDASIITSGSNQRYTATVVDNDETCGNGTNILKLVSAANSGNGNKTNALIDFSNAVKNATFVKIEFDSYVYSSGRASYSIVDKTRRDYNTMSSTGIYADNGLMYHIGTTDGKNISMQGSPNSQYAGFANKWVHNVVEFDYAAKKMSYTATTADGETTKSETNIDYVDKNASFATTLEWRTWVGSDVGAIDNFKVYANIGELHTVTINYQDMDGNTIKTSETDTTAVATLPYTVDAAKKAIIDDGTKTYRYTYSDESVDTISSVGDGADVITLKFVKTAYQPVTFTAKIGEDVKEGVAIKVVGTPADTTAAAVDETLTTAADGTASIKLLPGTYSYSIEATSDYQAVASTSFTVANEALPVEVALEANSAAPATLKLAYTTTGDADGVIASKTIYGEGIKFEGDEIPAADFAPYLKTQKVLNSETNMYTVYDYTSGATEAKTLTAGENIVYAMVTEKADKYFVYDDFEDLEAGMTTWANTVTSKSYAGVVSSTVWTTAKPGGFNPAANSAAHLENNQAVLLATHSNPDEDGIIKNLNANGNVTVSFDWAKNDSSGGRYQLLKFVDESENVVLYLRMSMANSKGLPNGIYYSTDGTSYKMVYGVIDSDMHSYKIDFDMTNHTFSIAFDNETKVTSESMAATVTGANIATMRVRCGYSVVSSLMDNLAVRPYTAE